VGDAPTILLNGGTTGGGTSGGAREAKGHCGRDQCHQGKVGVCRNLVAPVGVMVPDAVVVTGAPLLLPIWLRAGWP
jgi:hypothetical protein